MEGTPLGRYEGSNSFRQKLNQITLQERALTTRHM